MVPWNAAHKCNGCAVVTGLDSDRQVCLCQAFCTDHECGGSQPGDFRAAGGKTPNDDWATLSASTNNMRVSRSPSAPTARADEQTSAVIGRGGSISRHREIHGESIRCW